MSFLPEDCQECWTARYPRCLCNQPGARAEYAIRAQSEEIERLRDELTKQSERVTNLEALLTDERGMHSDWKKMAQDWEHLAVTYRTYLKESQQADNGEVSGSGNPADCKSDAKAESVRSTPSPPQPEPACCFSDTKFKIMSNLKQCPGCGCNFSENMAHAKPVSLNSIATPCRWCTDTVKCPNHRQPTESEGGK